MIRFLSLFLAFATITEMQDTRNVIDKFKGRSEVITKSSVS